MEEDRVKHAIAVARKMIQIAKEKIMMQLN